LRFFRQPRLDVGCNTPKPVFEGFQEVGLVGNGAFGPLDHLPVRKVRWKNRAFFHYDERLERLPHRHEHAKLENCVLRGHVHHRRDRPPHDCVDLGGIVLARGDHVRGGDWN